MQFSISVKENRKNEKRCFFLDAHGDCAQTYRWQPAPRSDFIRIQCEQQCSHLKQMQHMFQHKHRQGRWGQIKILYTAHFISGQVKSCSQSELQSLWRMWTWPMIRRLDFSCEVVSRSRVLVQKSSMLYRIDTRHILWMNVIFRRGAEVTWAKIPAIAAFWRYNWSQGSLSCISRLYFIRAYII